MSVVVPTNYVGVAARRMLGSGALGPVTDRGVGVAGVTFLTVYRIAEMLGAPRLAAAGRRPCPLRCSAPRCAACSRASRACSRGSRNTRPPNRRSSTRTASCRSATTPRSTGSRARADARPRSCASTARRASALAGEWYDERDLMDTAVTAVAEGSPVLADLGAIVLYLPQDLSLPGAALLRAVAEHAPLTVVAGITGVERADAGIVAAVARLDLELDRAVGADPLDPPHGTEVVSASDPDDEVRAAVRLVMAALVDGVPLERMAILYGATEPYARLVHEQLSAAGIPHNGAAVRTLAESVLGRSLLGLLALPDRDFHRHDVMALLAGAPVWFRGHAVPSARWERISQRAGVVRGAAQWHERLDRHAQMLEAKLAEERAVPDREPHPDWYEHELQAVRDLDAFVAELRDALATGAQPGLSWRELSAWARGIVREFLAHDTRRRAWPEAEQRAADKVEAALDRLAGLDAVEPAPGLDVFRRTLELELERRSRARRPIR